MEVDTGAAVSILSESTYNQLCEANGKLDLMPPDIKLKLYTGHRIGVLGSCLVTMKYEDYKRKLSVLVVKGQGLCLLGQNWLSELKLNLKVIGRVEAKEDIHVVIDKYCEVFERGLGMLRGVTAKIHIDLQATSRFYCPHPVPYACRQKVETELDGLDGEGIVERIQFYEWVVPVLKQDGFFRLCGDYKLTVNHVAKLDMYPLPKVDDLLATLTGGSSFTKLDLSQAYQQVQLDQESQQFVTINTMKGLYCYTRLPFGVISAPSIFQRVMENLLQGLKHIYVYIDDVLVIGTTSF